MSTPDTDVDKGATVQDAVDTIQLTLEDNGYEVDGQVPLDTGGYSIGVEKGGVLLSITVSLTP